MTTKSYKSIGMESIGSQAKKSRTRAKKQLSMVGETKKEKKWVMNEGDEYIEHKYVEYTDDDGIKKRKRVRVIAHQQKSIVKLTPEQVAEIEIIFKTFDKDNSGGIEVGELKDAMKALGLNKTKAEVEQIMEKADKDGSKSIEMDEFTSLMAVMIKDRNVTDEL